MSSVPYYSIRMRPRDLLFFRDGRPMEASNVGDGANWPLPSIFHQAMLSHCHRLWPEPQRDWEYEHQRSAAETRKNTSCRFGSIKTAGPFPLKIDTDTKNERLFLPSPADITAGGTVMAPWVPPEPARSDLTTHLPYVVAADEAPTKKTRPGFVSTRTYDQYLLHHCSSDALANVGPLDPPALFTSERRMGIEISPETHATVSGQFYGAEYLRLQHDVCLQSWATSDATDLRNRDVDILHRMSIDDAFMIMGGQQGVMFLEKPEPQTSLPLPRSVSTDRYIRGADGKFRVKWILLSPAVYPQIAENQQRDIQAHSGGWLPNWICPVCKGVMLKGNKPPRSAYPSREAWRTAVRKVKRIPATLVAACIPKPLAFSGWSLLRRGESDQPGTAKPTCLAVPAGSVYYFECDSRDAMGQLVEMLSWDGDTRGLAIVNRRSTLFGEKGFGLGVCAPWDFLKLGK